MYIALSNAYSHVKGKEEIKLENLFKAIYLPILTKNYQPFAKMKRCHVPGY